MITIVPLLLGLAALACAVVLMMRQARSADRRPPVSAAGDPLFFVRHRPGLTEVEPASPASGSPAAAASPASGSPAAAPAGPSASGAENPPAGENS